MKRDTINYLAVGVFVLAAIGVLLGVLYKITGRVGQAESYYVTYPNITGLMDGSLVTYEGYQVGFVQDIVPVQDAEGTRYRVELSVRHDWKIPEDSRARIAASGLLAETVINIEEGDSRSYLPPGSEIRGEQGVDLFAVLGSVADDLGGLTRDTVRPLLENLNRQVSTIGGELEARLPRILQDLETMVGQLEGSARYLNRMLDGDTEQRIDRIVVNTERFSNNLVQLSDGLDNSRRQLDEMLAGVHDLVDDNDEEVRQMVLGLRRTVDAVAASVDAILYDLEGASRNMNEFTRQIRSNPGVLLTGKPPQDAEARP
ncbi:MlaD family protein [Thiohalobacter sp. IOR34]|uniref:MlaD family protein n=1 Tax=Thiohalobacter sp. IOR34 TaxID=3057176 RepID=UPI0025AFD361|nr:MlaD family protein [Thiohalobacter sp. IOR34]WJW74625.1 MlaD family protein [Thiohalobacter sp. IOR34]